ncbi:molecular chaperone [Citrobacter freundii]|uniref:fimbrial biogenesis chaperone n=1 Tax=Citrobacter freundii TaxID=546 RepID=UPI0015EA876E|nr:molecular chaperone [Citrobacter freundii]MBA7801925.1 molecular chaperone [Citrobacter freundii]QMD24778.1 molecular chaperone [Citrobacter freundii]
MRILIMAALLPPLFYSYCCPASGIQVGRTRIIFDANKKEVALALTNTDTQLPWLIQSWTDTGDEKTRGPFIVTPPLFRLDAQKEQSLRISWNGTPLPENKESLFYMNVRTIPATAKEDESKNVLRLIYKTRIKLFWRPKKINGTPIESCKQLQFTRSGNQLQVTNNNAFYTVFDSLRLGAVSLPKADMVAPFSTATFPLPGQANGNQVSWHCITDYGNASQQYSAPLSKRG